GGSSRSAAFSAGRPCLPRACLLRDGEPQGKNEIMKYFTPDLYQRLQDFSSDAAMDAAEAAWEGVRRRYQRYLRRLFPTLPRGLKGLLEKFYLHDAEVLSMGEHDKTFV